MNSSIFRPISLLMVLFALALTACTAAPSPTATDTPAPPAATLTPTISPPPADGSYVATITKDDFKGTVLADGYGNICEEIGTYLG